MNNRCKFLMLWLVSSLFYVVSAAASEPEPEWLAEVWQFTPKPDMVAEFEQAVKAHRSERVKLADPRQWQVYSPVLGNQLDTYIIRSCCYQWQDMDSYVKWTMEKNPMAHFNQHIAPTLQHSAHYFSVMDMKNSNWPAELEYRYVGVNTFYVKPGHGMMANKGLITMSEIAKKNDWPLNYSWMWGIGGSPRLYLAIPYNNYAHMAPPAVKFNDLLKKHFGNEAKALEFNQQWLMNFESTFYNLYVLRDDL